MLITASAVVASYTTCIVESALSATFKIPLTSLAVRSCGAEEVAFLLPFKVFPAIDACFALVTAEAAISFVVTEDLNANAPRSENHFATLPIRVLSLSPVATLVLLEA